jgi:hypothetical protein
MGHEGARAPRGVSHGGRNDDSYKEGQEILAYLEKVR